MAISIIIRLLALVAALASASTTPAQPASTRDRLGSGSLLHAHNCYPEAGEWRERLDRALTIGLSRLVIEQDVAWAPGSTGRPGRPVLSHDAEVDGSEPTLEQHRAWLTTAERVADGARVMPFRLAPLLVLTENGTGQEAAFSDRVPAGGSLLVFGTTPSPEPPRSEDPEVRARIQVTATPADAARLHAIVNRAHEQSLWIRFYTLNGHGAGCWRPAATDPSQS